MTETANRSHLMNCLVECLKVYFSVTVTTAMTDEKQDGGSFAGEKRCILSSMATNMYSAY